MGDCGGRFRRRGPEPNAFLGSTTEDPKGRTGSRNSSPVNHYRRTLMFYLLVSSVRALRRWRAWFSAAGGLSFQEDFIVGPHFRKERGCRMSLGERVSIGSGFLCMANLTVGDDVMISSNVAVIGDDHPFDDPSLLITESNPRPPADVVLEGDNLIGYGTVIIGPVRIGRGAVVGAGSLVTRDLPAGMVCLGRPAVPLRSRYAQ